MKFCKNSLVYFAVTVVMSFAPTLYLFAQEQNFKSEKMTKKHPSSVTANARPAQKDRNAREILVLCLDILPDEVSQNLYKYTISFKKREPYWIIMFDRIRDEESPYPTLRGDGFDVAYNIETDKAMFLGRD